MRRIFSCRHPLEFDLALAIKNYTYPNHRHVKFEAIRRYAVWVSSLKYIVPPLLVYKSLSKGTHAAFVVIRSELQVRHGFELKLKMACQALVHQLRWLRRAIPHSLKVCHDCLSKTCKVGTTTVGLNDEEDSGPLIDAR